MWSLYAGSAKGDAPSDVKVRVLQDGVQVVLRRVEDLSPLMDLLGRYLRSASQIAFLNQSFNGQKWPARQGSPGHPSILGAVQDLTDGPEIHASRFTDRPALVDTGTLRRSISYLVTGPKTVRLVSRAPYAQLHHHGGTSTLPVTATVRANLATLLAAQPTLRPALGFLFRRSEVSTAVPARPFLGVADSSRERVEGIARDYLIDAAQGRV